MSACVSTCTCGCQESKQGWLTSDVDRVSVWFSLLKVKSHGSFHSVPCTCPQSCSFTSTDSVLTVSSSSCSSFSHFLSFSLCLFYSLCSCRHFQIRIFKNNLEIKLELRTVSALMQTHCCHLHYFSNFFFK